jgi:hypothetical protein
MITATVFDLCFVYKNVGSSSGVWMLKKDVSLSILKECIYYYVAGYRIIYIV